MGELVEDRVRALLVGGVGHPGAEHHVLEERDAAGILHGAGIELGDEELVVLAEGVGGLELLLEECESLLRQLEDVVRIEVLGERLPAEDAHRVRAVRAHVLVANLVIRPRDEGGDVGRHSRGRGELPAGDSLGHGRWHWCRRVAHDLPVIGGRHRQCEGGLEIGLLEAGVHAPGIGGLELGIEVDLVIDRVDEAVQALAGVHVGAHRLDHEGVLGEQVRQRDAGALEAFVDVEGGSVEDD